MRVEIVSPTAALEKLEGLAVIFDVFRASNTILALLAAGAAKVALVADLDQARRLKAEHPSWLLVGERGGLPPAGFDGGNSPARAAGLRPLGRSAILTTSAGTQAVHRLRLAAPVFYGSLANAEALKQAIESLAPARVNLIAMGFEARIPALEDDLAAWWLGQRLEGARPDFVEVRRRMLACDGAQRLRGLGQEDDLAFCTALDSHSLIPEVSPGDPPLARIFAAPKISSGK